MLYLGRDASPQFSARPIVARMIKAQDWPISWEGGAWISVYELDAAGEAVEQRSVYVILAGVRPYVPPANGRVTR